MPTSEQLVFTVAKDAENRCGDCLNGGANDLSSSVQTFASLIEPCAKALAEGAQTAITKNKLRLKGKHSRVGHYGERYLGFFLCFLTSLSYASTLPIKVQVQPENGSFTIVAVNDGWAPIEISI